jgi:hypothetical protein
MMLKISPGSSSTIHAIALSVKMATSDILSVSTRDARWTRIRRLDAERVADR